MSSVPQTPTVTRPLPLPYFISMENSFTSDAEPSPRPSYQVINSTPPVTDRPWELTYSTCPPDVLRVVRKGPAIKNEVDDAIDLCAGVFNLRDSIEESRAQCEQASDERQKKAFANKGTRGDRRWLWYHKMTRITLSVAEPKAILRAHCLPSVSTLH